jgi:hypothetical protein
VIRAAYVRSFLELFQACYFFRTQQQTQCGVIAPSPVTLVEPHKADYLSGEANVAVSGNQNPVIRLGLSPNGVTIIEFPADAARGGTNPACARSAGLA